MILQQSCNVQLTLGGEDGQHQGDLCVLVLLGGRHLENIVHVLVGVQEDFQSTVQDLSGTQVDSHLHTVLFSLLGGVGHSDQSHLCQLGSPNSHVAHLDISAGGRHRWDLQLGTVRLSEGQLLSSPLKLREPGQLDNKRVDQNHISVVQRLDSFWDQS